MSAFCDPLVTAVVTRMNTQIWRVCFGGNVFVSKFYKIFI